MNARHGERGTTIVETAIVMAVLLMVLFGIMDFSRLLYSYHMVDNAARIGARFAAVRGSQCQHYKTGVGADPWPCNASQSEIQSYVAQQSIAMGLGTIPTGNVTAAWTQVQGCTAPPNGVNCQVAVTVTYPFSFWFPFMPKITGGTIPLTSTSEMIISQ